MGHGRARRPPRRPGALGAVAKARSGLWMVAVVGDQKLPAGQKQVGQLVLGKARGPTRWDRIWRGADYPGDVPAGSGDIAPVSASRSTGS